MPEPDRKFDPLLRGGSWPAGAAAAAAGSHSHHRWPAVARAVAADQAGAFSHTTISMPGATTASSGFPDNPKQGGAWIMAAGTSEAHLMLP